MELTKEQKEKIRIKLDTCFVCNQYKPDVFSLKNFSAYRTIDYKKEKTIVVCSKECKDKWESQFFVEEYKGNKIYCIDGKYIPYYGASYYFTTLEDVKKRIDTPVSFVSNPNLLRGGVN